MLVDCVRIHNNGPSILATKRIMALFMYNMGELGEDVKYVATF